MAFNCSPEVAVAREAARKLGADRCVIVFTRTAAGQMGYASYGENRALCATARQLGDELYAAASQWFMDEGYTSEELRCLD